LHFAELFGVVLRDVLGLAEIVGEMIAPFFKASLGGPSSLLPILPNFLPIFRAQDTHLWI
jgi:hypothetical protein